MVQWRLLIIGLFVIPFVYADRPIIDIDSHYERYGYYWDKFIDTGGLRYYFTPSGFDIYGQDGRYKGAVGFEIEGVFLAPIDTELECTWNYSNAVTLENGTFFNESTNLSVSVTYRFTQHTYRGQCGIANIPIVTTVTFVPHRDMKIKSSIISLSLINNFALNYVVTGSNVRLHNNRLNYDGFNFEYADLVENGFSTSFDGNRLSASPSGGQLWGSLVFDPQVTSWHYPNITGQTYNDWVNPSWAYTSDNQRASVVGISNEQDYGYFGVDSEIDDNADGITGIECELEAICSWMFPAPRQFCAIDLHITPNNFTTESGYVASWRNLWTTLEGEDWKMYGGSDDLAGIEDHFNTSSMGNGSFYVNVVQSKTVVGSPQVDTLRCRVYYSMPIPGLEFIDNSPANMSNPSSTVAFNVSSNVTLTDYYIETNYTGEWLNYSTNSINDSLFYRLFYGQVEGMNNGTSFNARGIASAGGDYGSTGDYILTIDSPRPTFEAHYPTNESTIQDNTPTLNYTITELDGDEWDWWLIQGEGQNPFNYIYYIPNSLDGNVTQTTTWLYPVIDFDIYEDDLVSYWKFDNLSFFNESDTMIRDFTGYANGTPAQGAYAHTNGRIVDSYRLDGDDDFIELNDGATDLYENICGDGCTFAIWIDMDTSNGVKNTIMAKWDDGTAEEYILFERWSQSGSFPTIKLQLGIGNGTTACQGYKYPAGSGQWSHYVLVYNVTHMDIYLDGELIDTDTCKEPINTTLWAASNQETELGRQPLGVENFDGYMDEFAIINRSLNRTEAFELYNLTSKTHYWSIRAYDSPEGQTYRNYQFTIGEEEAACSYDCGVTSLVTDDLDCSVEGLEVYGTGTIDFTGDVLGNKSLSYIESGCDTGFLGYFGLV